MISSDGVLAYGMLFSTEEAYAAGGGAFICAFGVARTEASVEWLPLVQSPKTNF